LTLYAIQGGLGHNFPIDAFRSTTDVSAIQPVIDNSYLFMAGMQVGSSDGFAYTFEGDFTVKVGSGAGARMDFSAWLLKTDHNGSGDFQGYLQYANGDMDGALWGKLGLLSDLIYMEIPQGAASLHFGHGAWHIWAGKKEGPRIRGHVLVQDTDSYLMLGNDTGLAIGGSQSFYLGVSAGGVASAYASGYMDMGLQITPQPHVIGDFAAGLEAGVCAFHVCVDDSVSAAVHAEAMPLSIDATFSMDLPFPAPDVNVHVHL
jgi:hypothetical protein